MYENFTSKLLIVCSFFQAFQERWNVGTGFHQVLAATLTLSQPSRQIMPTLYCWGPRLAKIRRGGPVFNVCILIKVD